MKHNLTKEEKLAIATLKRLAKKWPESLWLFSAAGRLHVMRNGPDGKEMDTASGGVDQNYSVTTVDIPNSGGDW